jgi:hypothetical protein
MINTKDPIMKLEKVRPLLIISVCLASALVFLVCLAQLPAIIHRYIPPYEVTLAEVSDAKSSNCRGVRTCVAVHYVGVRRRICQVDLDRFVSALPLGNVIWRNRVPGGARAVGPFEVVNEITLPEETEDGEYELSTNVFNDCPEGQHSTATPPVRFRLPQS